MARLSRRERDTGLAELRKARARLTGAPVDQPSGVRVVTAPGRPGGPPYDWSADDVDPDRLPGFRRDIDG